MLQHLNYYSPKQFKWAGRVGSENGRSVSQNTASKFCQIKRKKRRGEKIMRRCFLIFSVSSSQNTKKIIVDKSLNLFLNQQLLIYDTNERSQCVA